MDNGTVERANYESSSKRARRAMSRTSLKNGVVKDFQWRTGRWLWMPRITDHVYWGWNPTGEAARVVFHHVGYWLCLGWSTIEELPASDPRAMVFRMEHE